MARRRTAELILVSGVAGLVVLAACGRSGFLQQGGDDSSTSPTGTSTAPPTPTPTSSRFPTPGPTSTIGFGNGAVDTLATLTVPTVINSCYAVTWASNSTIAFEQNPFTTPFEAPHQYLLWQVQSNTLNSAGRPTASTAVDFNGAGLWEIVQADTWSGGTRELSIQDDMHYRYRSGGFDRAQVCHIPEASDFSVNNGARAIAQRWNGHTGGIVALMVSGNLGLNNNAGSLDALGAGFRGGVAGLDDGPGNGQLTTALDSLVATTAGEKGESLDGSAHERFAAGAIASGGGAGNNDCGGAGGGGNGGLGGTGGIDFNKKPNTNGAGGAVSGMTLPDRLLLGGGGGGGATHNTKGSGGAAGGGVVLLFANVIQNGGAILVGGSAAGANASGDGSGGGGAGGTILIYTTTSTWNGMALAPGGKGGGNSNKCGVGGGGAGGQIKVETGTVAAGHCKVTAGPPGASSGGSNPAQGGAAGVFLNCPP